MEQARRFEEELKKMPFHIEIIESFPHEPSVGAQLGVKTTDAFKQLIEVMDPSKIITIYKKKVKNGITYAVVYLEGLIATVTIGERQNQPFLPEWRKMKWKRRN